MRWPPRQPLRVVIPRETVCLGLRGKTQIATVRPQKKKSRGPRRAKARRVVKRRPYDRYGRCLRACGAGEPYPLDGFRSGLVEAATGFAPKGCFFSSERINLISTRHSASWLERGIEFGGVDVYSLGRHFEFPLLLYRYSNFFLLMYV